MTFEILRTLAALALQFTVQNSCQLFSIIKVAMRPPRPHEGTQSRKRVPASSST